MITDHHCFRPTVKMCSLIHAELNHVMILSISRAVLSCCRVLFSSLRVDCCMWLRIEEEGLPHTEMDFSQKNKSLKLSYVCCFLIYFYCF